MFENTFKRIDDILREEAGCTTELDYTEQTSWILFLKYLDDMEVDRNEKAKLRGMSYQFIIADQYRWASWAAPKKPDGSFDHENALTGEDLIEFVNDKLFPYLNGFRGRASSTDTIEYKIGAIFEEVKNKFQSGYPLRDTLEQMDKLRFRTQIEKHELIVERLFGTFPELFKNEDELRRLWSKPDTRRKLLEGLEEKGYSRDSLDDLKKIIDAEKCDIYDVLAYVAYAVPTITREERVNSSRNVIFANFDEKQREFVDFLLKQYVEEGVGELDDQKLPALIELKYNTITDGISVLGEDIREKFINFQQYLYAA